VDEVACDLMITMYGKGDNTISRVPSFLPGRPR
jgi:hypothetical protein